MAHLIPLFHWKGARADVGSGNPDFQPVCKPNHHITVCRSLIINGITVITTAESFTSDWAKKFDHPMSNVSINQQLYFSTDIISLTVITHKLLPVCSESMAILEILLTLAMFSSIFSSLHLSAVFPFALFLSYVNGNHELNFVIIVM